MPQAEAEHVGKIISGLNRDGVTVLLVEHNMRMVMSLSHDILVLNNGMRIAEGDAESVRRHPDVLAAYLGEPQDAGSEVEALTAGYGSIQVLHRISLRVAQGQSVCLIGANGAGKTTLLRSFLPACFAPAPDASGSRVMTSRRRPLRSG